MQQWLREAACPCGSDAAVSPQATVKAWGGGRRGGASLSGQDSIKHWCADVLTNAPLLENTNHRSPSSTQSAIQDYNPAGTSGEDAPPGARIPSFYPRTVGTFRGAPDASGKPPSKGNLLPRLSPKHRYSDTRHPRTRPHRNLPA